MLSIGRVFYVVTSVIFVFFNATHKSKYFLLRLVKSVLDAASLVNFY